MDSFYNIYPVEVYHIKADMCCRQLQQSLYVFSINTTCFGHTEHTQTFKQASKVKNKKQIYFILRFNTLRTGTFKLFKCTFLGLFNLNQLLYCVSLNIYNKFANYEGWNFNSGN